MILKTNNWTHQKIKINFSYTVCLQMTVNWGYGWKRPSYQRIKPCLGQNQHKKITVTFVQSLSDTFSKERLVSFLMFIGIYFRLLLHWLPYYIEKVSPQSFSLLLPSKTLCAAALLSFSEVHCLYKEPVMWKILCNCPNTKEEAKAQPFNADSHWFL